MSEGLVGMFFLAIATSFPEIVTGCAAVFSFGKIGLGYGDIAGSIIVNLMILVGLDYFLGRGRILARVSRVNRLTGVFVVVLLVMVLASTLARRAGYGGFVFKGMGAEGILVGVFYIASLEFIRRKSTPDDTPLENAARSEPFWEIWAKFVFFLAIVMVLGFWMAKVGDKIVNSTPLSETFTGTLLLGFATSLPEIIVSFAALKAASADMAVGNILGSNLLDICIVPILDVLTGSPILGALAPGQVAATGIALLLSIIAVAGMLHRRDTARRINFDTGLIFVVGLVGFVLLYFVG